MSITFTGGGLRIQRTASTCDFSRVPDVVPMVVISTMGVHQPWIEAQRTLERHRVYRGVRAAIPYRSRHCVDFPASSHRHPYGIRASGHSNADQRRRVLLVHHAYDRRLRIGIPAPVVMFALTMLGLVTSKGWLAHWRIAVVIAFVFAAVATPTGDIGTMSALALPICLLYFVTIAACWGYERVQVLRILCETGAEPRWLQRIRNVQRSLARPFRRRSRADDVSTTCQEG